MHHHRHCHGHEHHAAGRRGFRGPPFAGGPFGGPLRGGPGGPFRSGRMIGDGDLRLIVLTLLAEQPRHGYDIIKALEERSHGAYSPSPGVVYPTLTYLEEAGYADASAEGNKKVYAITDAGRSHLESNREVADRILGAMEAFGAKMAKARAWFYRSEDGGSDIPGVISEVNDARRALKSAIADRLEASEQTQRAMAEILREAAEAIRALGSDGDATDA
ncbi:MAG: helix-turn-helix transcriptional regulator [Bauldia sp.]|nr:helix-turn-helix transcriptional regulator [Bauldia sp.]